MMPMYDEKRFPYVISRSKFKIELVDLADKNIITLCTDSNTSGLQSKMQMSTTKHLAGHSIEIYFNCLIADKRATKCQTLHHDTVTRMFKEPEGDYF